MRSPEYAQTTRLRGVLSRLLLVLLGTTLGLGLAELVLVLMDQPRVERQRHWRTSGYFHQLDADLIYSARPDTSFRWDFGEFLEVSSTNSLGLRGPEPRGGELRILVLGDSQTFGHGVMDSETYPYQLEQRLRKRGLDAEVLNGGVKGYGTDQAYQLFRLRLRHLEPDILLLALNSNDIGDDADRPLFGLDGERLVPRDPTRDRLYRSTQLERALPDALLWSRTAALGVRFLVWASSEPPLAFPDERARYRWATKKASLLIRDLDEMARVDGFGFGVVALPARDAPAGIYGWLQPLEDEVPILDLQRDPAWRRRRPPLFFRTDPHFSPAGNAWVAERIDDFLARELEGPSGRMQPRRRPR